MSNFTKGRWAVSDNPDDSLGDIVIKDKNGETVHYVCEVEEIGKSIDEIRADAHLIAAAPDMYEKLLDCAEFLEGMAAFDCEGCSQPAWELLQTVEAVIARAEGKEKK